MPQLLFFQFELMVPPHLFDLRLPIVYLSGKLKYLLIVLFLQSMVSLLMFQCQLLLILNLITDRVILQLELQSINFRQKRVFIKKGVLLPRDISKRIPGAEGLGRGVIVVVQRLAQGRGRLPAVFLERLHMKNIRY